MTHTELYIVSGYNLSLPTATEQLLWRVNSIIMVLTLFVHCQSELIGSWYTGFQFQSLELWGGYKKRMPTCFIFLGLGMIYFISRIIILVESVISLRDLPEAAYKEVSWTQYLPRI